MGNKITLLLINPQELSKLRSPQLALNLLYWTPIFLSQRTRIDQTLEYYYEGHNTKGIEESLLGLGLPFVKQKISKNEMHCYFDNSYVSNPIFKNYFSF